MWRGHHWLPTIAIDLGSSTTRVWVQGADQPVALPSLVALGAKDALIAVGKAAQDLQERGVAELRVVAPVELGVIQHERAAHLLVKAALHEQQRWLRWRLPPVVMMTVPVLANQVQQERAQRFLYHLGAREAYLITQPLAATIGAGIPLIDSAGSVLVQLGGGRVEVAALTLGGITAAASSQFGGRSLIEQLKIDLREQYRLDVSFSQAETILHQMVLRTDGEQVIRVVGKDVTSGAPVATSIDATPLVSGLGQVVGRYVNVISEVLSQVPPAVTSDIVDRGILLSGGLAQLKGLSQYLSQRLQLPCCVVANPAESAIVGVRAALERLDDFKAAVRS